MDEADDPYIAGIPKDSHYIGENQQKIDNNLPLGTENSNNEDNIDNIRLQTQFGRVYSGLYPVGPRTPNFSSNRRNRICNSYIEDDSGTSIASNMSTVGSNGCSSEDKMYVDFPIRNFWKLAKSPIDMESPQIGYCRGFYYRLLVHPRGGSTTDSESSYLSVFLEALHHESYPDDWVFPNVRFQLSVVNFLDPKASITSWAHWTFSHDAMSRGWHKMVSHARLTKATGFIDEEGTVLIRGRAEPPFPRIWSRSPKCRPWNVWGILPYKSASVPIQGEVSMVKQKKQNLYNQHSNIRNSLCPFHDLAENSISNAKYFDKGLIQTDGASLSQINTSNPENNIYLPLIDRLIWSSSNLFVPTLKPQLNVDFVPAFMHLLYHLKEFRRAVFCWNSKSDISNLINFNEAENHTDRSKRSDSSLNSQSSIIEALQRTFAYMTLWPIAYAVKSSIRYKWQETVNSDPLTNKWCPHRCCKCGENTILYKDIQNDTSVVNNNITNNLKDVDWSCHYCRLPTQPDCTWLMKTLFMSDLQRIDVPDPLMRFHCFLFGAIYLESAHSILQIAAYHRSAFVSDEFGHLDNDVVKDNYQSRDEPNINISASSMLELEEYLRIPTEFDNTCRVLFSSVAEDGGDCFLDYSTCCLRAKHIHSVPKAIEHYNNQLKRFPEVLFIYFSPPKNAKKGELFDVPFRLEASFLLENDQTNSVKLDPNTEACKYNSNDDIDKDEAMFKEFTGDFKSKNRTKRPQGIETDLLDESLDNSCVLPSVADSNDDYSVDYISDDGFDDGHDISTSPELTNDGLNRDFKDDKVAKSEGYFGPRNQFLEKWYSLYGVIIREGDTSNSSSGPRTSYQILLRPEEDGPWFRICDGLVERLIPKIEFTEWKCHGGFFCAAAIYIAEDYIDSIAAGDVVVDCDLKSLNPKLYYETLDLLSVSEEDLVNVNPWISTQANCYSSGTYMNETPVSDTESVSASVEIANATVCDSSICNFGHPLMDVGFSLDPNVLWMLVDYRWGWPYINSYFGLTEPLTQAFAVNPALILSAKIILTPSASDLCNTLIFRPLKYSIPKLWALLLEIMFGPDLDYKDLDSVLRVIPHLRKISSNIFHQISDLISEDTTQGVEQFYFTDSELIASLGEKFQQNNKPPDNSLQYNEIALNQTYANLMIDNNLIEGIFLRSESVELYDNALLLMNRLHNILWPNLIQFVDDLLPVTITIRLKRLFFRNGDDLLFDPRLTPEDLCARFLTESKFLLESSCCPLNLIRNCENGQLLSAAVNQVADALDAWNLATFGSSCTLSCSPNRVADHLVADMGSAHFVIPIVVYIINVLFMGLTYRTLLNSKKYIALPDLNESISREQLSQTTLQPTEQFPTKQSGNLKRRTLSNKINSTSNTTNGVSYINPLSQVIHHLQTNQVSASLVDPYVFIPMYSFHAASSPLLVNIVVEQDLIGREGFGSESMVSAIRVLHVNRLATVRHLYIAIRKLLYAQFDQQKYALSRISSHNINISNQSQSKSCENLPSKNTKRMTNSSTVELNENTWIPSTPLDLFFLYSLRPDPDPTRRGRLKYTYMSPNDFVENHAYGSHRSSYIANCDVVVLICVPPELKLHINGEVNKPKLKDSEISYDDICIPCPSRTVHSPLCSSYNNITSQIPKINSSLLKMKLIDPLWSATKLPLTDDSIAPLLIFKWFDPDSLNITLLSVIVCEARKPLRDCIVSWVFPRARKMGLLPDSTSKETFNAEDYNVMEECHIRVCQNVRRWTSSIKKINRTTGDVFIVQRRQKGLSTPPLLSGCPFIAPFLTAALCTNSGILDEMPSSLSKSEFTSIISSLQLKKSSSQNNFFSTPIRQYNGTSSSSMIDFSKEIFDKTWPIARSPLDAKLPILGGTVLRGSLNNLSSQFVTDISQPKVLLEESDSQVISKQTSEYMVPEISNNVPSISTSKKKKKASKRIPGIPSLQKSSIVKALNAQRRLESRSTKSGTVGPFDESGIDEFVHPDNTDLNECHFGDTPEDNKSQVLESLEKSSDSIETSGGLQLDNTSSKTTQVGRPKELLSVSDVLYNIATQWLNINDDDIRNLVRQLLEAVLDELISSSTTNISESFQIDSNSYHFWINGLYLIFENIHMICLGRNIEPSTILKEFYQVIKDVITGEATLKLNIDKPNKELEFIFSLKEPPIYRLIVRDDQRAVIYFVALLILRDSKLLSKTSFTEIITYLLPKMDYIKSVSLLKTTSYKLVSLLALFSYIWHLISSHSSVSLTSLGYKVAEMSCSRLASYLIGLRYSIRNSERCLGDLKSKTNSWFISLKIIDRLLIYRECIEMTLTSICERILSDPSEVSNQNKRFIDIITGIDNLIKFESIVDIPNTLKAVDKKGIIKDTPVIIEDSDSWSVILKPPFWNCLMEPNRYEDLNLESICNSGNIESILGFAKLRLSHDNNIKLDIKEELIVTFDDEISGPVLISKSDDSYQNLLNQYNEKEIMAEYVFLCHGQLEKHDGYISFENLATIVCNRIFAKSVTVGSSNCIAKYKVCGIYKHVNSTRDSLLYSLCRCHSTAGSVNKIRAFMSEIGHPIVCDSKFLNNKQLNADRRLFPHIFFHCWYLEFLKPDKDASKFQVKYSLPSNLTDTLHQNFKEVKHISETSDFIQRTHDDKLEGVILDTPKQCGESHLSKCNNRDKDDSQIDEDDSRSLSSTMISSLPGLGFGLTPFLGMPNSQYAASTNSVDVSNPLPTLNITKQRGAVDNRAISTSTNLSNVTVSSKSDIPNLCQVNANINRVSNTIHSLPFQLQNGLINRTTNIVPIKAHPNLMSCLSNASSNSHNQQSSQLNSLNFDNLGYDHCASINVPDIIQTRTPKYGIKSNQDQPTVVIPPISTKQNWNFSSIGSSNSSNFGEHSNSRWTNARSDLQNLSTDWQLQRPNSSSWLPNIYENTQVVHHQLPRSNKSTTSGSLIPLNVSHTNITPERLLGTRQHGSNDPLLIGYETANIDLSKINTLHYST
ncbi:uncharacterized protein CMU_020470 [Cryptosporidium muris RN66]|uniref:MATH domain-containing protein n=1 Tax=Cryptosporidium muris (strain RN66) TaxID=441375 RepID=B6AJ66_CRYMR|nr:uncharacterized protein CMU_020470 [Cryptosporidium muris RN66]EEA08303.1 hypothetical protein, conserved [Cryptosporidium muris RN66]|eukprot:XP_002142652.1 hypothetical protein [Cryptosporidium muris RN66]